MIIDSISDHQKLKGEPMTSVLATATPTAAWHGPGPWIVLVPFFWLALIVAFFAIRRAFWVRGTGCGPAAYGRGGPARRSPSAAEILDRRFAEGEIDAGEYRERRAALERAGGEAP